MILMELETGPLQVNTYIVGDEKTKEAMVVDPGGDVPKILTALAKHGLTCKMIFNTHTHWDHTGGNAELKRVTGAPIVTHADEAAALGSAAEQASFFGMSVPSSPPADQLVKEGDTVQVGALSLKVIELPGHSPCGLGLLIGKFAIVGDALFAGSIGRTDFPGGDLHTLLDNIRRKLFTLPDDTVVLSGHGPRTTVGQEKKFNPFF
jgi:glyoxylase-like metal-dependent hydrolase (beta-lactamase superfamily II)